jgi:RNA polymerase sigma-70 factor (ECF subfamily)
MLSEKRQKEIHNRLLENDPTASAELVEGTLETLIDRLQSKFPSTESELILDAVTDALMSYIKKPSQFDPEKRSLVGYLSMSARGDLLNAFEKIRRRNIREIPLEDVELNPLNGNIIAKSNNLIQSLDAKKISKAIKDLFSNPIDQKLADLIIDGERSTEAFAKVLGIESVSIKEQRREVKRHKDRIKKRLSRYGKNIQR